MVNKLQKDNKGFTIIEVLIVLAIAGLIMLIVFLAVPALQRNQRNNSRNSEASRIAASVSECLANRNGMVDSCDTWAELQPGNLNQLDAGGTLPTGQFATGGTMPVAIADDAATAASTTNFSIRNATVWFRAECADDGGSATALQANAPARNFVVLWRTESNLTNCISS